MFYIHHGDDKVWILISWLQKPAGQDLHYFLEKALDLSYVFNALLRLNRVGLGKVDPNISCIVRKSVNDICDQ